MPAFLLSPLVRWGIVAAVMALLIGAVIWLRHEAGVAREAQKLAETQARISAEDATRWQDAAAQRQGVIDRQTAELKRLESDGAAAREIADKQQSQAQEKIAALEAKVSKLKEAAHARPEDVRQLGPIVRDALPSLRH